MNQTESEFYGSALDSCNGLIVRTLGAGGAEALRSGDVVARASSPAVSVVDTTGAGDTFTAAITVALVSGLELDDALAFACAAGALATTRAGAQPSLPMRADVETMLQ